MRKNLNLTNMTFNNSRMTRPPKMVWIFLLFLFVTRISAQTPESNFRIQFDPMKVPFSRYGSYMAVSVDGGNKNRLMIQDVTGKYWSETLRTSQTILQIDPKKGNLPIPANYSASQLELKGELGNDSMKMWFAQPQLLIIESTVNLKLTKNLQKEDVYPVSSLTETYRLGKSSLVVSAIEGSIHFNPQKDEKDNEMLLQVNTEGHLVIAIEMYNRFWMPKTYLSDYSQTMKSLKQELSGWMNSVPSVPAEFNETRLLAAYINWSSIVEPRGNLMRPGMLMSKNWMFNIWSWDHCFNALSLAYSNPSLSWDQFMILFDRQDSTGGLPDCMSAVNTIWGITKPPIHGWILSCLMNHYTLTLTQKEEAYRKLKDWTNFWFLYHDEDHNGIPQYYSGAGSGWDNGTPFDIGTPLESPDLLAYLILQMDMLEKLANQLGDQKEAEGWRIRADKALKDLIQNFWDGEQFHARKVGTGEYNKESKSLMNYLPLILGDKLPESIITKMVKDLKEPNSFISDYGICSESQKSSLFDKEGYWRGPVWAPTSFILSEALRKVGEKELSKEIAFKFCRNCEKNGFGENFNPVTGKNNGDPAYTWTTSVFLVLAHDYLK